MERPAVARRERTMWRMHARGLVRDGDGGGGGSGGVLFIASRCVSLTRSFLEMKKWNSWSGLVIERI